MCRWSTRVTLLPWRIHLIKAWDKKLNRIEISHFYFSDFLKRKIIFFRSPKQHKNGFRLLFRTRLWAHISERKKKSVSTTETGLEWKKNNRNLTRRIDGMLRKIGKGLLGLNRNSGFQNAILDDWKTVKLNPQKCPKHANLANSLGSIAKAGLKISSIKGTLLELKFNSGVGTKVS